MSEEILKEICEVLHDIHSDAKVRQNLDSIAQISANNPYVLDYRGRYYVYIFSPNSLTLTCEDLGNFSVSQSVWTNISFTNGMKIFASGQTSLVPIFVRCTDIRQG